MILLTKIARGLALILLALFISDKPSNEYIEKLGKCDVTIYRSADGSQMVGIRKGAKRIFIKLDSCAEIKRIGL